MLQMLSEITDNPLQTLSTPAQHHKSYNTPIPARASKTHISETYTEHNMSGCLHTYAGQRQHKSRQVLLAPSASAAFPLGTRRWFRNRQNSSMGHFTTGLNMLLCLQVHHQVPHLCMYVYFQHSARSMWHKCLPHLAEQHGVGTTDNGKCISHTPPPEMQPDKARPGLKASL